MAATDEDVTDFEVIVMEDVMPHDVTENTDAALEARHPGAVDALVGLKDRDLVDSDENANDEYRRVWAVTVRGGDARDAFRQSG